MRVLGVVVVPNGKKPRVHAAILEGSVDDPVTVSCFEVRTSALEPSEQAVDLARMLSAKLSNEDIDAAGIRMAGTTPVGRRSKAAFSRAHCEGALLFVLRKGLGKPISVVDANGAARATGMKRAALDELAARLVWTLNGANADAVIAALAALAAADGD